MSNETAVVMLEQLVQNLDKRYDRDDINEGALDLD